MVVWRSGARAWPRTVAVGSAAVMAVSMSAGAGTAGAATASSRGAMLQHAVDVNAVLRNLATFESIADANGGTRASGTRGYDRTAAHLVKRLERAGYAVKTQEFPFVAFTINSPTVFERLSPDAEVFEEGVDYSTASYTGDGEGAGEVVEVDVVEPPGADANTSTSGCEASDFADFPAGAVALLQRGTCEFGLKARLASEAGASAAVIYNEGTPGDPARNELLFPTLGDHVVPIPTVGVSYEFGRSLVGTQVRVVTDVTITPATTRNVIAETKGGRADQVVMLGGHLDSVPAGPGINDNGTGSAALLEVAEELARSGAQPRNTVRFAWWGAEESGLLGSNYYVANLAEQQAARIRLYLNFDMIGSPNYFRGVYDGNASLPDSVAGPAGSAEIEALFNSYFERRGLPYEDSAFSGRSDYQAFILSGIPAGGLFTGAEGEKTAEQVKAYGGIVAAYDPCYHQACDTFSPITDGADASTYRRLKAAYGQQLVGNVHVKALDTSSDAIAHAVATYGWDLSSIPARDEAATTTAAPLAVVDNHGRSRS